MRSQFVTLEGTVNTRDLCGFTTTDGRKIKPNRLIRSEHFARITEEDAKKLTALYAPATIVDLRAKAESEFEPDIIFPGAKYVHLPILRNRQELDDAYQKDAKVSFGERMEIAIKCMGYDVLGSTTPMYAQMIKDVFTVSQYAKMFELLLRKDEGAVLWHCSAGKDRTGMAAALILLALGVDLDVVREDYLDSNTFLAERTERYVEAAEKDGVSKKVCDELRIWCGVRPEYFDAAYYSILKNWGSVEDFITKGMGLTYRKREQLKGMYLE